jgi:hypothetical protein
MAVLPVRRDNESATDSLFPAPQNPAFFGQAAVIFQAGRLARSRLAKQPAGLGLDRMKPTWTLHFHSAWPMGFVPDFGFGNGRSRLPP